MSKRPDHHHQQHPKSHHAAGVHPHAHTTAPAPHAAVPAPASPAGYKDEENGIEYTGHPYHNNFGGIKYDQAAGLKGFLPQEKDRFGYAHFATPKDGLAALALCLKGKGNESIDDLVPEWKGHGVGTPAQIALYKNVLSASTGLTMNAPSHLGDNAEILANTMASVALIEQSVVFKYPPIKIAQEAIGTQTPSPTPSTGQKSALRGPE